MARLSEQLRDWLARAEILARGAERRRIDAARALDAGRPWEARYEALAILDELPRSPVALALWADAAEAMLLDHEVAEALAQLVREVPFRADVWLRLASVHERLGADPRAELERAAELGEPTEAADWARLYLADRDLRAGDGPRAERWLGQLSLGARSWSETLLRRVEVWLATGDTAKVREASAALPDPAPLDGRRWLTRGRILALDSLDAALPAFSRALLLDAPGALEVVAHSVARSEDLRAREQLRQLVADLGLADDPRWRAAVAIAEGRRDQALRALADAARQNPDPVLADRYLSEAVELRDVAALAGALALLRERGSEPDPALATLAAALEENEPSRILEALDAAGGRAAAWAAERRRAVYRDFWGAHVAWRPLLTELAAVSGRLVLLDLLSEVEAIAIDLDRPLRVAVVGEFNAGKSSFINALLGEAVAPVGVLPTTATLNTLAWAPDRFARIERRRPSVEPDRVIAHGELRSTLAGLDPTTVAKVTLYAPLEPLRRVEILDTPGFNAPDAAHTDAARRAFTEAHAAIWLLDAAQPLKESERAVLAEISGLGVPLLVLVNKLDRLDAPTQVDAALAHVTQGLAEAGLAVEAPPIAFSARLALSGRAGDGAALERSNWRAVESVLERTLVDRSDLLRERVLRRRARAIAVRLGVAASQQAAERRRSSEGLERRSAELAAAVSRIGAERASLELKLEESLESALAELDRELRPIRGVAEELSARRFIVARARATIGAALARTAVSFLALEPAAARYVAQRLKPRSELLAAAVAPWLRSDQAWASQSARSGDRVAARTQIVALVVDELSRIAEDGVTENAAPPQPPAEARAEALAEVLGELGPGPRLTT